MPSNTPPAHQTEQLQQAFLRHLPQRIAAIGENWQRLTQVIWEPRGIQTLLRRIQELASTSKQLELTQLTESAHSLALHLQGFADTSMRPSDQQVDEANHLLRSLKVLVGTTEIRAVASPAKDQALASCIYYLRASEKFAPGLVSNLESRKCPVTQFTESVKLLAAMQRHLPTAILVDEPMAEHIAMLSEEIHRLLPTGPCPPVAVIAAANNLASRLRALRAGADAYFVTPIDSATIAEQLSSLAHPQPTRPFRILIVEDDVTQAEFAAAVLSKAGMEIITVTDPFEVIDALESQQTDLILMDLYMPEANGMELTRIIRERDDFLHVPIVFLSGEQNTDRQLEAMSVGGDDFLAKPVRPKRLISTVANRIRRARNMQQRVTLSNKRDPVTGLLTRPDFLTRLEGSLDKASPENTLWGILYIEVDDLLALRQDIGIGPTDALFAELASIIAEHAVIGDSAARYAEDGFALLVKRDSAKELMHLAKQLLAAVAQHRFQLQPGDVRITISIGVCHLQQGFDASGLVARAAKSCHLAQGKSGNQILVHVENKPAESTADKGSALADQLQSALQTDSLQTLFQPFVNLQNQAQENYQILIQLRSVQGDPIHTQEILAAAQEAVLSTQLNHWLLNKALNLLDQHRQAGRQVNLLINPTAAALTDKSLVQWVREQLRERHLTGTGLILEFNLIDVAKDLKSVKVLMASLQEMGITLSLSRFNGNAASFKILHYLQPAFVKIAQTLLKATADTVTDLANQVHENGAKVIVPQIDDPRTIGHYWASGADFVQGNLVQRPAEDLRYNFAQPIGT